MVTVHVRYHQVDSTIRIRATLLIILSTVIKIK